MSQSNGMQSMLRMHKRSLRTPVLVRLDGGVHGQYTPSTLIANLIG